MFSLVDGCTMSAKKDGMANIGGFIACRSNDLMRRCWEHMVEIEGFYTNLLSNVEFRVHASACAN
jgi:tryptophanase